MSNLFKDRQSTYPNRYKITDANGKSSYITLERADVPTVEGTVLNAAMLNQLLPESGGTVTGALRVNGGFTSAGNCVLNGSLVLTSGIHYGTSLPAPGTKGRIFFKKVGS
jgi:hypothetical protein